MSPADMDALLGPFMHRVQPSDWAVMREVAQAAYDVGVSEIVELENSCPVPVWEEPLEPHP